MQKTNPVIFEKKLTRGIIERIVIIKIIKSPDVVLNLSFLPDKRLQILKHNCGKKVNLKIIEKNIMTINGANDSMMPKENNTVLQIKKGKYSFFNIWNNIYYVCLK